MEKNSLLFNSWEMRKRKNEAGSSFWLLTVVGLNFSRVECAFQLPHIMLCMIFFGASPLYYYILGKMLVSFELNQKNRTFLGIQLKEWLMPEIYSRK